MPSDPLNFMKPGTVPMDDALKKRLKGKQEDELQCECGSPWFTLHQVQETYRIVRMARCAKCHKPI